ncbi:MAG: oxygen-independent coproporphyrinogen III oxidase [Pseudomonadota bacterium]
MKTKTAFERLGLFDARVPRYTSYPPATQFSDQVGPRDIRNWITKIAPGTKISLYLHIPFCRRLCWFCACRTQGTTTLAPLAHYMQTLATELDLLRQNLPDGIRLGRVHWGGGTPTLLDSDMIDELAEHVRAVGPFADDAEFSVEIDPNEIDQARVTALAKAGMTRASIGVQDFDPMIQEVIGREQSFEVTQAAVDMLRVAGVDSLNTDILFGLPHQTQERITASINKLLSLGPDRVALYGYAHVPWVARRQNLIPSDALPTPRERLDLFEVARKLLTWDGYREIGIDHFALPDDGLAQAQANDTLKRNFQGYTDDQSEVLIGVGASSISRFPQGYAQNAPSTSRYHSAVEGGDFATVRGHKFTAEDRIRGPIIEALMCRFEISVHDAPDNADVVRALIRGAQARFGDAVHVSEDRLVIRPEARALTRVIARHFDTYEVEAGRHASAI